MHALPSPSGLAAVLAALMLLALTGCSHSPAPPGPEQMVADCRIELLPVATVPLPRLQLFGNSGEHWAAVGGGCTVPVGLREMGVQLHLPLSMTEADVRQRVQIRGIAPTRVQWRDSWSGRHLLEITFPPGSAGQEFSVSLDRVPDAHGQPSVLAVRLQRFAPAAVTLSLRQGDGPWRRPVEGEILTPGPLSLQAVFSAPVDRDAVAAGFWSRVQDLPPEERPRLAWLEHNTLQIEFPRAPRQLEVGLKDAYDGNGLAIDGAALVLRSGLPAALAAVDPGTRQETRLFALPPDPRWVRVAASGRWVAVGTEEEGKPDPVPVVWVLEGRSGRQQRTVLAAHSGWLRDDVLVGRQNSRLALWDPTTQRTVAVPELPLAEPAAVSPDGLRIAWLRWETPPAGEQVTAAADLLVYTPATGEVKTYDSVIHRPFSTRPSGRDQSVHLAWAPDGGSVAALDTRVDKATGESSITLVSISLAGGKATALLPAQPGTALGTGLDYAPDGKHILIGAAVWDLTALSKRAAPPLPVKTGAGLWSPDGRYVLAGGNWGPVYAVEATTGRRIDLGTGLVAGWQSDGRALVVRMVAA